MGRIGAPHEIMIGSGADKAHPERHREELAKSEFPIGDAPEDFSEPELAAWNEIVSQAVPGVLTAADRQIVEQVAALLAEFRKDRQKFSCGKHGKLATLLAHLGMTPSGRRNVPAPKGANGRSSKNGFDDF